MRNLKRALSLALASVMLLGMMVVGTSAASYTDVDEKDNVEAIEVLNAVNVMIGRQGNFEPDEPVNRHEMAVIMAKLVLGVETADSYVGSHPFTDVVPWADKYVAACYENGLVAGTSSTTFSGGKDLTAVEAAAMMLRALGYKDLSKGATDWRAPVTAMANQIRLFSGVASNPSEKLDRNQVAQLALNTLKSPVVDLKDGTFDISSGDGQVIITGGSREYIVRSSYESYARAINRTESAGTSASSVSGYTIELGEHLYNGKLRLEDTTDAFGRPARQWEYDGKEIGTYAKEELLRGEYLKKVTGKDLYDLLGKTTIDEYDFTITVDGETEADTLKAGNNAYFTKGNLVRTNTNGIGATGNGVLTQVFVDANEKDVYIAIINTYLAIAADDYNEKKEEATFDVYGVEDIESGSAITLVKNTGDRDDDDTNGKQAYTEELDVRVEDIDVSGVKDDEIYLVRVAEGEIKELIKPEILSDKTISAFKRDSWVKTDGTQYDEANTALYDTKVLNRYSNNNLKDLTYNLILDTNGYMIGIEQNEDPDQYVFITGNDGGASDLTSKEIELAAIFLDGTMKVIKVDAKKSDAISQDDANGGAIVNRWFKYTKSSSDVYTLKDIANTTDGVGQWAQNVEDAANVSAYANAGSVRPNWTYTIDKAHVALIASSDGVSSDRRVYGNDDTVYLLASTSVINTKSSFADQATDTGNGISDVDDTTPAADAVNYYKAAGGAVQRAVIIDDVDSITVGVKNVNLVAKDVKAGDYQKANNDDYDADEVAVPKSEIYTLFDEDGYVIAAVVIGEDEGSAAQYAYVHSSEAKSEAYGHTSSGKAVDGKWSWERDVIIDGEIVTLTEVSDGSWSWIDNMEQGHWYKVSFNADGEVRKTEDYNKFAARYANDVDNVETYYDNNQSLIILEVNYTGGLNDLDAAAKTRPSGLTFENGTLYTDINNRKGFAVAKDVKVVYANAALKKGADEDDCGNFAKVKWFDEVEDGYTGYEGVKRVLRLIDSRDASIFCGVLNAVIKDGVATSIIINDTYGEYVDEGGAAPKTEGIISTEFDGNDRVTIIYSGNVPSNIAQLSAIIAELESQDNVSNVKGAKLNGDGTFNATLVLKNGSEMILENAQVVLATSAMDSSGMKDVVDELENQTIDPYEFGGSVAMDAKKKTVTFTGAYGDDGTGSIETDSGYHVNLMTDLSRFLGALYRQMGVRAITFDGENYTWKPEQAAAGSGRDELAGSNWYGEDGTLVADVVTASGNAIDENEDTIDGVSFTMDLDGVTWTIKIALDD